MIFGCFFFAAMTFFGFWWRSNVDPWDRDGIGRFVVDRVWLWPVIFLAFVGVWWEQRKKVKKLDEEIKEAEVAERELQRAGWRAEAKEKRAKAAAKKKRAEAKKKRESGQN